MNALKHNQNFNFYSCHLRSKINFQVLGSYNLIIPAIIYTCGGMLGMFTAMLLPMETKGRAMKVGATRATITNSEIL